MERDELKFLEEWQAKKERKPLLVKGARQVGKTWLLKHFGKSAYKNVVYINFETNTTLKELFSKDFNLENILTAIQIETGILPKENDTLIIFDEIQESPKALLSLKYFYEEAPSLHIVAAGSLLGVALSNESSFPVGKVEFLDLFPLNFVEFLVAINQKTLANLLLDSNWELINTYADKFKTFLKYYYFIGGMPEAVFSFSEENNFEKVRAIQNNILLAYELDFAKHIPTSYVTRVRQVWNIIPSQLAKENKKFIFKAIKEGARSKEFELAIMWLQDSGLITKVHNVDKPAIPLKAYQNENTFKLYLVDIGLLAAMVDLSVTSITSADNILTDFKGALTEQYVLQQIVSAKKSKPYYWALQNSQAEVDFVLDYNNQITPIEVKAAENLQSKSLKIFAEKYNPQTTIRTSMSNYREESWLMNVPLFAINNLYNIVNKQKL